MPSGSQSGEPSVQSHQRSLAGNIAFGAGLLFVLATMTLGAFAAVSLGLSLVDDSFLSSVIPGDGRGNVVVGGIGVGGLTGLFLPLILFGTVAGTPAQPKLKPVDAARRLLALLTFDLYLVAVSVLASQLGWILPKGPTMLLGVFVVGFSWLPLALIPWERYGLGDLADKFEDFASNWEISREKLTGEIEVLAKTAIAAADGYEDIDKQLADALRDAQNPKKGKKGK